MFDLHTQRLHQNGPFFPADIKSPFRTVSLHFDKGCRVHRSGPRHGASKHKHPRYHSHAPASARSNTAERTTPRNAKACGQMAASNGAGSAALGMKKPTSPQAHARVLVLVLAQVQVQVQVQIIDFARVLFWPKAEFCPGFCRPDEVRPRFCLPSRVQVAVRTRSGQILTFAQRTMRRLEFRNSMCLCGKTSPKTPFRRRDHPRHAPDLPVWLARASQNPSKSRVFIKNDRADDEKFLDLI